MRSLLIMFLISGACYAQAPDIPADLTIKADELKSLEVKEERPILWLASPGLQVESCGRKIVLFAKRGGIYQLRAIVNSEDAKKPPISVICVVTVEGAPPPPNPPPQPPPTPPSDPLFAELQRLFREDSSPTKAADLAALAALYELAAETARKPEIATAGRLLQTIRLASQTLAADKLQPIRQRIGRELAAVLPSDPNAQMTAEVRESAAKKFLELSALLKRIN